MRRPLDPFAPAAKPTRSIPFDFVLEELAALEPATRPMFGCTAVYLEEPIVFVLRKKSSADDGVWVAFEPAREQKLSQLFPRPAPIELSGKAAAGTSRPPTAQASRRTCGAPARCCAPEMRGSANCRRCASRALRIT